MQYTEKFVEIKSPESLLTQIEERDSLDYKANLEDSAKGKADFIKDCSAIANYGGGVLIYGVDKQNLIGLPESDMQFYDPSRLHDRIKGHLSPVPKIITQIISHEGKKFPFVKIAGIDKSPILVSKKMYDERNGPLLFEGDIYTRQNTQTIKVQNEAQIRHILEQIINSQLAKRLAILDPILKKNLIPSLSERPLCEASGKKLADEKIKIKTSTPTRQVLLLPKYESKFKEEDLKNAFSKKVHLQGHAYPHYALNNPSATFSRLNNGFVSWFGAGAGDGEWRCLARQTEDGSFFWVGTLFEDEVLTRGERSSEVFKDTIGVIVTLYFVQMALAHARTYLTILGDNGIWTFTYRLTNIGGRKLVVADPSRAEFRDDKVAIENNIEVSLDLKAEDLETNLDSLVWNFTKSIFQRFNWYNASESQLSKDIQAGSQKIQITDAYID